VKHTNRLLIQRGLIKEKKTPLVYYRVVKDIESRLDCFLAEIKKEV
jgi:hypothetical protein